MTHIPDCWQVLGLPPGATEELVKAAHGRLIRSAHPDAGGNNEWAARINRARDEALEQLDFPATAAANDTASSRAQAEQAEQPGQPDGPTYDDFAQEVVDLAPPRESSWQGEIGALATERLQELRLRVQRSIGRALPTSWQRLLARWSVLIALAAVTLVAMRTWHWSGALAPRASLMLQEWAVPSPVISVLSLIGAVVVLVLATVMWPEYPVGASKERFFAGCLVIWVWSGSFLAVPLALLGARWLLMRVGQLFHRRFLAPDGALLPKILGWVYGVVALCSLGFLALGIAWLVWSLLW